MLGLGLAASSAHQIFEQPHLWQKIYNLVPPGTEGLQPFLKVFNPPPPPPGAPAGGMGQAQAINEKPELINQILEKTNAAYEVLRKQLEAYKPDAIVIVGADRGEMFSRINMPMFATYLGKEAKAIPGVPGIPESLKEPITVKCHSELGTEIVQELVAKGFDISFGLTFNPQGGNKNSISHMVTGPVMKLTPNLNVPVIPFFINSYFPPLPPARRCFELGLALRGILNERPERVAILASGGLSSDMLGRWVDEPLDRWIIKQLTMGRNEELKKLFTIQSQVLDHATGEIRAWITVAAACGGKAKMVDYIPSRQAKTGLAFAYWQPS